MESSQDNDNFGVGLVACVVSGLAFGSMFVPIKPFKTGDGLFVQFLMGCAIMSAGLVVQLYQHSPAFQPLAMLGGVLWACGNITAVPIVNLLGMTIGLLLWSTSNCLFGWAAGRFGWFDTRPQVPASDWLNAMGLILALISAVMFALVKSENSTAQSSVPVTALDNDDQNEHLLDNESVSDTEPDAAAAVRSLSSNTDQSISRLCRLLGLGTTHGKRTFGVLLSLAAGLFYGLCFTPIVYIKDHKHDYPGATDNDLDYVFSQYSGVFLTCTVFFVVYCSYRQNRPFGGVHLALPSLCTGLLWAIGQTSWFVANRHLSEAVSFPIVTRLPGIVAALWGVLYFREIKGRSNLVLLCWAMLIAIIGSVLSALSRIIHW